MDTDSISGGILVLLLILFLAIIGGNALRQKKIEYLHESGLATVLGMIFGLLLELFGDTAQIQNVTMLNSEFVLFVLLPPIIFQSGYNIDKQVFFGNFGAITTYAFIGILISTIIISWGSFLISTYEIAPWELTLTEAFAFGIFISSTDPVSVLPLLQRVKIDNNLYNIIFGEGLFNGAISISMYRTILETSLESSNGGSFLNGMTHFILVFCGSFVIGGVIALFISWVLKKISGFESQTNVEATAVIFGPWISYLISEGLGMNGTVSILFCGIFMARYTTPNLSTNTQLMIRKCYSVISYAAETLVFIFLGMGLFSFNLAFKYFLYSKMTFTGIFLIFIIIFLARCSSVIGCSWILNGLGGEARPSFQILMCLTGLKGIIAFALASTALHEFEHGDVLLTITIIFSITGVGFM